MTVLLSEVRDARRAAFSLLLLPIWHLLSGTVRVGHVTDTDFLPDLAGRDLPVSWLLNGPFTDHFKTIKDMFAGKDRYSFLTRIESAICDK